jgi:hypothetical protein
MHVSLVLSMLAMISACGAEKSEIPKPVQEFQASAPLLPTKKVEADPPYIVQEACTFWLVTPIPLHTTHLTLNIATKGSAK